MNSAWVFAGKSNGWVDVDDVEFLNVEESPFGDVMYFEFNGESFESNVVFGSNPG